MNTQRKNPPREPEKHARRDTAPPVRTMHDDVDPCSDDICCCEAEPRWQQLDGNDLIAARLKHAGDAEDGTAADE